jgi:hypothetical protein
MAPKSMLDVAKDEIQNLTANDAKVPEGFTEYEWRNPLEKEGDMVEGLYLSKGSTVIKSKPVNTYLLERQDGSIAVVRGVHQIDANMETVQPRQHRVWFCRGKEQKCPGGKVTLYRFASKRVAPREEG